MKNTNFTYEIKKHFGIVSNASTLPLELNLISYNGASPKYDLRKWRTKEDGRRSMQKGLTLTREELQDLRAFLNGLEDI